jgi:DNA mismatch repair ATPase MutL
MTTRTKGAESGVRAKIEGGPNFCRWTSGCPEGTTIIIRDLFSIPPRGAAS